MNKDIENLKTEHGQCNLPYTHCLNCGTELQGMYCHVCGQEAISKTPTVSAFVLEYFSNAFIWDAQFLKTFWTLIRRPGHLTNEYLSGKFISQEHPLKLNMFLLFVFITLFVFFAGTEKMNNSVLDITNDESVRAAVQLDMLKSEPEYADKIKESPRDTVRLQAPFFFAEKYPEIISKLETIEDAEGEVHDKWVAVLPHVLIEEKIVVLDESGCHRFNSEANIGSEELEIFNSVWTEMVNLITRYFPMLALFTVPVLSMSLAFVQRKSRLPRIHHFIFALHYTAFLEFLMLGIYLLYLMFPPSIDILNYIMIIGSCVYLTIAFRKVYGTRNWAIATLKALFTSLVYCFIGLVIFLGIFLVACCIIADKI